MDQHQDLNDDIRVVRSSLATLAEVAAAGYLPGEDSYHDGDFPVSRANPPRASAVRQPRAYAQWVAMRSKLPDPSAPDADARARYVVVDVDAVESAVEREGPRARLQHAHPHRQQRQQRQQRGVEPMTLRIYPLNDQTKRWFVSSVVSTRERQILNRVTASPAVSPAEADGLAVAAALREDPSAAVSVVGSLEIAIPALTASPSSSPAPALNPAPTLNPNPAAAYLIAFVDETLDPPALRGVEIGSEYPLGVPTSARLHQLLIHEERAPTFADALRALSGLVAPPPHPPGAAAAVLRSDLAWVRPYLTDRAARGLGIAPSDRPVPRTPADAPAMDLLASILARPEMHCQSPESLEDVSLALASLFDVNFRDSWRRFCAQSGAGNSTYASTRASLIDVRNAVRTTLARTSPPAAPPAAPPAPPPEPPEPPRDVDEPKEGLKPPARPAASPLTPVSDEDRRLIESIEDAIERADYQSIGTATGRYALALDIFAVVRAHAASRDACGDVSSDGHACEWRKAHGNPMHCRTVDGAVRQWKSGERSFVISTRKKG